MRKRLEKYFLMNDSLVTTTARGLLPVKQAAALLGVCPRTVWRMIADGQLPAVRFRRCTRVHWADVARLTGIPIESASV